MTIFGRCVLEPSEGEETIAFVEVTLEKSSEGAQVAGRTVSMEVPNLEFAYESAAVSGWFFALQRIRALHGSEELPSVRLVTLRIAVAQPGVSTEQIAALTAGATYRALGGAVAERSTTIPELP